MSATNLRWGILSTAQIARKNWKAIRLSGNGIVTAVASRDAAKARQFIAECQAGEPMETSPRALGSYEELIASPEVDAIYIPLPTGLRKQWVLRAAAAGKHVVCEKPCANSVADLREMIDACRRHRVQFLDGVMFMHSARLPAMRAVLEDGQSVGAIKRITSSFSFSAPPEFFAGNIRASTELERYGCLGDLGWYNIRFALWAMNWQMPHSVTGRALQQASNGGQPGVPIEFSGELFFEGGVTSSFYCSFLTANEQCAQISGSKGYLRLPDFVVPYSGPEVAFEVNHTALNVRGCDFNMDAHWERRVVAEHSHSHPTSQETNLFRNFASQAHSGRLNDTWPQWALQTQQVMEACFHSARASGSLLET